MIIKNTEPIKKDLRWIFFGSSHFSVLVLEQMKMAGFLPNLIIASEDKPKGRKLILTPPDTKIWAEENNIPCLQPKTLKNEEIVTTINSFSENIPDLATVASYGKIIPQNILDIPKYKTLNVHPSLLPLLRGASPIKSAILSENKTGVTIIKLDAEMDHGPIISQKEVGMPFPIYDDEAEEILANEGGKLLVETIPDWINGTIKEVEQDHSKATFCKKIEKIDGEINLEDSPEKNLRKIYAFHTWPGAYFFVKHKDKNIRVIIKRAHLEEGNLIIDRVLPEGKNEMDYEDFKKGLR